MLVAVLPGWAERTAMARVAAQQAARVAALSPDPAAGHAAGLAAAAQVAANHGVPSKDLVATITVPVDELGDPRRGGEVAVTVRVAIPVPDVPFTPPDLHWRWTVTHSERIDDYRSLP
jgi:hypothetical protein